MNETNTIEETPKQTRVQRLIARAKRQVIVGLVAISVMATNAAAVDNTTFQGVVDIIDAIIPLFTSLLDLIIAVFPITIAMALLGALTVLITGIFYKVTRGSGK